MKESGKLIVITGPIAAGKDTVVEALVAKHGWHRVVTHTSRAPRVGEVDGHDYHFVSKETFLAMKARGEFAETNDNDWAIHYYGTTKKELSVVFSGKNALWRIDPMAALNLSAIFKKNHPTDPQVAQKLLSASVICYVTVGDWEVLRARIIERDGEKAQKNLERLGKEREDFEANKSALTSFSIYNEDGEIEATIAQIEARLSR